MIYLIIVLVLISVVVLFSIQARKSIQSDKYSASNLQEISKFDYCLHQFTPIFKRTGGRSYRHHHVCTKCGYITKPLIFHPVFNKWGQL